MLVIEDCRNTTAVTVLVRGGNKMIVEEVLYVFCTRSSSSTLRNWCRSYKSNIIFDLPIFFCWVVSQAKRSLHDAMYVVVYCSVLILSAM